MCFPPPLLHLRSGISAKNVSFFGVPAIIYIFVFLKDGACYELNTPGPCKQMPNCKGTFTYHTNKPGTRGQALNGIQEHYADR